jgi:hypothetical protein
MLMHIKRSAHERGANLVEAAVVIPLLLIMASVVIDLGRAYFTSITMIDVAREGARYGAANPGASEAEICGKALAEAGGQVLPVTLTCRREPDTCRWLDPLRVTVSCNFTPILGTFVGVSSIPMRFSVAFSMEKPCP